MRGGHWLIEKICKPTHFTSILWISSRNLKSRTRMKAYINKGTQICKLYGTIIISISYLTFLATSRSIPYDKRQDHEWLSDITCMYMYTQSLPRELQELILSNLHQSHPNRQSCTPPCQVKVDAYITIVLTHSYHYSIHIMYVLYMYILVVLPF